MGNKGTKNVGEDRGTQDIRHTRARAVWNAKNLCIKLVPFEKRGDRQTVWGEMSKEHNRFVN